MVGLSVCLSVHGRKVFFFFLLLHHKIPPEELHYSNVGFGADQDVVCMRKLCSDCLRDISCLVPEGFSMACRDEWFTLFEMDTMCDQPSYLVGLEIQIISHGLSTRA